MFRLAACAVFGVLGVFAQYPASVRNAASLDLEIAPGSLAVVQLSPVPGLNSIPVLDPATTTAQLNGNAIPVIGRASNFSGLLVFIPADTPLGAAQFTLKSGAITTLPASVNIVASNFGLYDAVQNYTASGPELNQLTHSAQPGGFVTIWGTGLGKPTDTAVYVGGIRADVTYAGSAPGLTGVDQINFRVPQSSDLPLSCYVGVQVRAGGRISNLGSLSIATGSTLCDHPFGLSEAQLATLDRGGSVSVGLVSLSTSIAPATPNSQNAYVRTDSANASFLSYSASSLRIQSPPVVAPSAIGGCQTESTGAALNFLAGGVNVGDMVTLTAPSEWFNKTLDLRLAGIEYSATLPPSAAVSDPNTVPASFFNPGSWTVSAPGGTQAQSFQASFDIPGAIRITNLDALQAIDRSQDAVVTWDPATFTGADILSLSLSTANYGVGCQSLASTGQLTIPSSLLSGFTANQHAGLQAYQYRRGDRLSRFTVPLLGGGSMPSAVRFSSVESVTAGFR